jgi:hypothetical protein
LDESTLLTWFEEIEKRVSETRASETVALDVWAASFAEMHAALESVFPPSHTIVRQWEDATSRARRFARGPRVQTPELWIRDELNGIFRTALALLKNGLIRSLADGVRAETVAQCLDQAEALGRAGYAAAAMILAGGALETHLRVLCMRFSLSWQGSGSIGSYKQALDQARNQGTQSLVSSSDSSQIESWGKDRNEAAHVPANFAKAPQQVLHIVEGIRQFVARTQ